MAGADGISLADPSAPVNPEQAARGLGELLARRHAESPSGGGRVELEHYAAVVRAAADEVPDAVIESGPYLDRSCRDLARVTAETVDALPASDSASAAITPGLDLGGVVLGRDGSLTIEGATVAGDRHLDLARVAVALAVRYGPAAVAPFLDAYGLDGVDLRRLDTCQLLTTVADALGVTEPVR